MDRQSLNIAVFTALIASLTHVVVIADDSACSDCDGCTGLFSEGCNDWIGEGCCDGTSTKRGLSFYTSLSLAGSFTDLDSGGFNNVGFFPNTGSDSNDSFDIGGAIGIAIPTKRGQLRVECEALSRDMFSSVTNSFRPPTPIFFYDVDLDDRWSVMGNLWYDIPVADRLDLYFGGGVGTSGGTISADDGVVAGQGRYSETIWQIGAGVNYHCSDRFTIDLGYRYVDSGTAETDLAWNFRNLPAGNYTADMTAHQIQVGFRFNSIGDILRRN
jgi:opacity protein-like surface antigen